MDNVKYDAILYVTPDDMISESSDKRMYARKIPSQTRGFTQYWDADDP